MDSFNGSSSTPTANDGGGDKPESSSLSRKPPINRRTDRSIMFKRFQADTLPSLGPYKYVPVPFFFYGTLMDPLILQEVLRLPEPPVLKPATVKSYKIMLWGQYPALVEGSSDAPINGMTYVIESDEQQKLLERYETRAYGVTGIRVTIEGKTTFAKTFKWMTDTAELVEGTWSLEEWKRGVEEEMASHFRPVDD